MIILEDAGVRRLLTPGLAVTVIRSALAAEHATTYDSVKP